MTILGTDLSKFNGPGGVDMSDFHNEGIDFVISRVSDTKDDDGPVDRSYAHNRDQANKYGLTFAGYANYYPDQDYKEQADAVINNIGPGVPFMVDLEQNSDQFDPVKYQQFLNYMSAHGHPVRIAYIGLSYNPDPATVIKIAGMHAPGDPPPIWDRPAYWTTDQKGLSELYRDDKGDSNVNWTQANGQPLAVSPAIWQYSKTAVGPWTHEPGSAGVADADAFKGSIDDFRQAIGLPPLHPANVPQPGPATVQPPAPRPLTGPYYEYPPSVDLGTGQRTYGQQPAPRPATVASLLSAMGVVHPKGLLPWTPLGVHSNAPMRALVGGLFGGR